MPGKLRPDDICYVNCAHCTRLLVGETTANHVNALYDQWPKDLAPPVFVRVGGTRFGRPLCESCGQLEARKQRGAK
jgi:hypothetical protein